MRVFSHEKPAFMAFDFGARHQLFGSDILFTPTSRPWQLMLLDVVFFIQIIDSLGNSPTVLHIHNLL